MDAIITDSANWPRCIQIAWQLLDDAMGNLIEHQDYLVKPEGFNILTMLSEFMEFRLNCIEGNRSSCSFREI
jgi:hypothetical protein